MEVAVGIPAELLRRRPDIRRAELHAAAQSSRIGVAKADLFPHFSLVGNLGLLTSESAPTDAGGSGSTYSDVFDSDSFYYYFGPSFKWDFLNYGRIKNRVRVEDARFQQLVVSYQNTVLRAAQEVEDGMVGFLRSRERVGFLGNSVDAYKRSVDLSMTQYTEGQGDVALNLVNMYRALGGGWQQRAGEEFISDEYREEMAERTDWGDLLEREEQEPEPEVDRALWRTPDW
jgi:outer membrane protein TolC